MDILQVANEINTELGYLSAYRSDLLGETGRASIFNSMVTCIISESIDVVTFAIFEDSGRGIAEWAYDLSDADFPVRTGAPLVDILHLLDGISADAIRLRCDVRFSPKFLIMDAQQQGLALRGTIFETSGSATVFSGHTGQPRTNSPLDTASRETERTDEITLDSVRKELREVVTQCKLSQEVPDEWMHSFMIGVKRGILVGVRITIAPTSGPDEPVQWTYRMTREGKLLRTGISPQMIRAATARIRSTPHVTIRPVTTYEYGQFSSKEQTQLLNGTIWERFS